MDAAHRNLLQRKHNMIIKDLMVTPEFLGELYQDGIINMNLKQQIEVTYNLFFTIWNDKIDLIVAFQHIYVVLYICIHNKPASIINYEMMPFRQE